MLSALLPPLTPVDAARRRPPATVYVMRHCDRSTYLPEDLNMNTPSHGDKCPSSNLAATWAWGEVSLLPYTHSHARTHTDTRTHTRTHARTCARTHI